MSSIRIGNVSTSRARKVSRFRQSLMLSAAVASALAIGRGAAHADLVWDPDGVGGIPAEGGAGNWNAANAWFNETTLGYTNWPASGVDVVGRFEGTGGAVTINSPVEANVVMFHVGGYSLSGPGTLTLVPGTVFPSPTLSVSNLGDTATINAALAGTAGFTKGGAGTLVLTADNSALTGIVTVQDGILAFSADNNLGAATNSLDLSSGMLRYTAAPDLDLGRAINAGGGGIDIANAATTVTLSGLINGFGLSKNGAGTLVLTNAANSINNLNINDGALLLNDLAPLVATGNLGLGNLAGIGTIKYTGATPAAPLGASVTLGELGGVISVDQADATLELTGTVSGGIPSTGAPHTAVGFTKLGAGTLKLSSAASNFTGNFLIRDGTVEIGSDFDLGDGFNGVTLDGGVLRLVGDATIDPGAGTAAPNSKFRVFRIGDNGGTFDVQLTAGHFHINDGPVFAAPNQLQSLNPITGPDALNPAVASADVLTKTGPGKLLLGNASDSWATAFTGTSVIQNGIVRLDSPTGLGIRQITVTNDPTAAVPSAGILVSNTPGVVTNNIILANGGTLASAGGDRTFSGAIDIQGPWAFSPADMENLTISRDTTLSGPITASGDITIGAYVVPGPAKGLTLANLTATPSSFGTNKIIIPADAILSIGGSGTGAGSKTGLSNAQIADNVQLLDGGTFGLRSDEATTFGNFPALPATNFGLSVGRLDPTGTASNLTLKAGPLVLGSQTATVTANNGYRLAPSELHLPSSPTIRLNGAVLVPDLITNTGAAGNTVVIEGDSAGQLVINNESAGTHAIGGTTFDLKSARVVLQGGTAATDPLGGAAVAFNGGALGLTSTAGGAVFNTALNITNASGRVQHLGSNTDTYGSGANGITIGAAGTLSLEALGGTLNIATPISGSGNLNISGQGAINLQADNTTYTGTTTVNSGRLVLSHAGGNSIGGPLVVNGGNVDLSGTAQSLGSATLSGGRVTNGTFEPNTITKTGNPGTVADISARINGVAGGISVTGGTLRISNTAAGAGANTITGAVTASNGGTLSVHNTAGGSDPLSGQAVNLNSGTLRYTGTNAAGDGLMAQHYSVGPFNPALNSLSLMTAWLDQLRPASTESTTSGGSTSLDFPGSTVFFNSPVGVFSGQGLTNNANFMSRFTGQINITGSQPTLLQTTSDDGSMIWIDGKAVAFNNYDQGAAERGGYIELTPGLHDIVIGYYQGTGGHGLQANITPFGGTDSFIPNAILSHSQGLTVDNDIIATGNSALTISDALTARVGNLTASGTFRVNGNATVASTTLSGNTTIDTPGISTLFTPGVGESAASSLTKTGTGVLAITGPSSHTGGTIVNGGSLRITDRGALGTGPTTVNAFGLLDVLAADVDLSSAQVNRLGRLLINATQTAANGAAAPTAPIQGTFEVRGVNIAADYDGLTIGDGGTLAYSPMNADRTYAGDIVLDGGTANFASTSNSVFVTGAISGAGGASFNGGTWNLDGGFNGSGAIKVEGGVARLRNGTRALDVPSVSVFAGEININDNPNSTQGDRIGDDVPINLRGGTLSSFMRNSGGTNLENVGALNIMGGARVNAAAGTGDAISGYVFDSLNRQFGTRVAFDGTNLGGTATNRGEIHFDVAPTLTNGIIGGWAVANNADFATYGPNGVTALTGAGTGAETTWTNPAANHKFALGANIALTGARQANSLVLAGSGARTVNFAGNSLTISDNGGLLVTGNDHVLLGSAVTGTSFTTDPGTLTSAGPELFVTWRSATAGRFLDIQSKVTGTNALVLNTNGDLIRLRNNENDFSGGLYLNGGAVEGRSVTEAGSTLGSGPIFLNGATLQIRDTGPASSQFLSYDNDVTVNNNSTINVDRSAGSNTSNTIVFDDLVIAPERTLTVTNGNSYRVNFNDVTLSGASGTYNNNANGDFSGVVTVPAGTTFVKSGSGFLTLTQDNAATFQGTVRITAGNLQPTHLNALGVSDATTGPTIEVLGGAFVASVENYNMKNITFGPAGILNIRTPQNLAGGAPLGPIPNIDFSGDANNFADNAQIGPEFDVTIAPGGTLRFTGGTTLAHNLEGNIALLGDTTITQTQNVVRNVTISGVISGPGAFTKNTNSGTFNVALTAANTYSGGTRMGVGASGGLLQAQVTGALGTGPVDVASGFLDLNATAAADNSVSVSNGSVNYNADNAAGDNIVSAVGDVLNTRPAQGTTPTINARVGQVNLGSGVTGFGGDSFIINPNNIIRGESKQLALLNRNTSGTNQSNIAIAPGAIVAHVTMDTSAPTIGDLGTASDLIYGIGTNFAGQNLTIGAGTPWRGLSNDFGNNRIWQTGTITIAEGTESIDLIGASTNTLAIGNNGNNGTAIVKAGGSAVPANVYGRVLLENGQASGPTANYSGISEFVLQRGGILQLAEENSLGGGSGTSPVPVRVLDGGMIDPGSDSNGMTLNSQVTVEAGGIVQINDARNLASSTGSLVPHAGSIFLLEGASNDVLNNVDNNGPAQLIVDAYNGPTTPAGVIVRLNRSSTRFLNESFADNAIFQVVGGDRNLNPTDGFGTSGLDLDGGGITNDNGVRTLNNGAIRVGPAGATFTSTTQVSMNITSDIEAAGNDLTIGTTGEIAGFEKLGMVRLRGTNNAWRNLTVVAGEAELADGAGDLFNVTGQTLIKSGAYLRLNGNQTGMNTALKGAGMGTGIVVEKGGVLQIMANTSAGGEVYTTPITFSSAGTGTDPHYLLLDKEAGGTNHINVLDDVHFQEGSEVRLFVKDFNRRIDARINAKLDGSTTIRPTNQDWSFLNVTNTSATETRTLTLGSAADARFNTAELITALGGAGQGPIVVDQVRGGLSLGAGSTMASNVTINNLGSSHALPLGGTSPLSSPAAAALVDGFVEIRAGAGGTGGLTGGTINLGGGRVVAGVHTPPQDVRAFVNEVPAATDPTLVNTVGATVNVVADSIGVIQSERGTDSDRFGRASYSAVNLAANSQVYLESRNDQEVEAASLNVATNGAINNISNNARVLVGNVTGAAGSKVTFDGTNITRLTGNVSGLDGAAGGQLIVRNRGLQAEAGAGTLTISAPVQVLTSFGAATGTVDLGSNTITGASGTVAGLREGVVYNSGTLDELTTNTGANIRLGPVMANSTTTGWTDPANPQANDADQQTYIYTGEIFVANRGDGMGELAFAESLDDGVTITIDGTEVLDDRVWNVNAATGKREFAVAEAGSWLPIEIRVHNGGGGAGASNQQGWTALGGFFPMGLGIDNSGPIAEETALPVQANYQLAADNGTMNLFRTTVSASGTVSVNPGATLKAGNVSSIANLNVNGTAELANVSATTTIVGDGTAAAALNANHVRGNSMSINAGSVASMNAGSTPSDLHSLTIAGTTDAWTGKLDLKDNDMVLRATDVTRDAVHDQVFNQLKQGLDAANPVGFWAGTAGITSSTAAANQSGFLTSIGMIVNDYATANLGTGAVLTDIGGVAVDINDVIMKYTWAGDADLNGTIDGGDYFLIDNGFAQSLVDGGWLNGDFDYNGVIDGGDYFLIDNSFAQQGTTVLSSRMGLISTGNPLVGGGSAVAAAVPEPTVLGLLAVGSIGLLGRRRRRA